MFYPGMDAYNDYFLLKDPAKTREKDLFNDPQMENRFVKLFQLVKDNVVGSKGAKKEGDFLKDSEKYTKEIIRKTLDEIGFAHSKLEIIEHHHAHATSAYYTSGVPEALIVTIDGAGDGLCATVSTAKDGKITRVSSASANCSPGRFYSEITKFLGFKRNRHEGKITGLAAFGDPKKYYNELAQFMRFDSKTESFTYEEKKQTALSSKLQTIQRILNNENFGNPYVDSFHGFLKKNFDPKKDAKDLAAAVQAVLEDVSVQYIKHFLNKYPSENILLAGGVFANVRVNQKVNEIKKFNEVYIHQNMGDGGCSLGAAFSALYELSGKSFQLYKPNDVYFGQGFTNDEIKTELIKYKIDYDYVEEIEKKIAELIHSGKVVGRFNGGMEYGPRALGNRSIVARPTESEINNWLNKKLKRTEFMPFAPSVLFEYADDIFHNYATSGAEYASYFMTITYDVKEKWRNSIQAATHVDGTARPQVVKKEHNSSYYKLIEEYYKLSGIPVVINTSFNMHEEPIVATPYDAIRAFEQGAFDYLAIGNYLCKPTNS
jgi:carbamoyltransferase